MKLTLSTLIILAILPSLVRAQDTELPLMGVWNGFLNQLNVIECSNLEQEALSLTLTVTDYSGGVRAVVPFDIAASGTRHITLNDYGILDSYGSYLLESSTPPNNQRLSCVSVFYRLSGVGAPKPVEYAYSIPMLSRLQGVSAGVYNSFNPSLAAEPVYNYLSIYNPGDTTFAAQVEVYRQDGSLDHERSFSTPTLAPNERRDFALGHLDGQVVGLYRIIPEDNSRPYGAFLSRYARNSYGGFQFAFSLLALLGSCAPGPVPASTMDPAINWGEVANPTSRPIDARIRILDRNGQLLLDELRTVAPFSQHHTHINTYLGERNVGTFHASCSGAEPGDALLVQSMYYGRINDLTPEVEWAYASQAMGNMTSGQQAVVSQINTFLGAANWNKVLDAASSGTELSLDVYGDLGSLRAHRDLQLAAGGALDVGVHESVGSNFIGHGIFSPYQNVQMYPELLRVFPHTHTSIGYILSVPNAIIDAAPPSERQRVLDDYVANYLGSAVNYNELGWSGSTASCQAGDVSTVAREKVLQRINYFRRTAGLPDNITLDLVKNSKCQAAALMMSANGSLSHYPPTSWECYTAAGAEAAGKSNIALGYHSTSAIAAYMNDFGTNNDAVGHRRWILYSRAKVMGDGSTGNAHALWVIGDFGAAPVNMPSFIAWPPEGYVPSPLVYGRWSFGIPGASFTSSTVRMTDAQHNPIALQVRPIKNGYGDNTIVWEPEGIIRNSEADVTYHVAVENVVVGGETKTYFYDVIIVQPTAQSADTDVSSCDLLELGEAIRVWR